MELPIIGNVSLDYKSVGIGIAVGAVAAYLLLKH